MIVEGQTAAYIIKYFLQFVICKNQKVRWSKQYAIHKTVKQWRGSKHAQEINNIV
jgi:hypothetical protein